MKVLISGAGIAGPTLAWWLHRACPDAQITILEKNPENIARGQNIDIRNAAVEVVRRMGLLDKVRECNTGEKGLRLVGPDGKPVTIFEADGGGPTAEFEILRGDLASLLHDATKADARTTYRFNTSVVAVERNDARGVEVRLSSGAVEEYDVLVAADGQWSKLRASVFAPEDLEVVDMNVYYSYFTMPREDGDDAYWEAYHETGSRVLCTRPDPHGTTRGVVAAMPLSASSQAAWQRACRADRQSQEAFLSAYFADSAWAQTARLMRGLASSEDLYMQSCAQIRMRRWGCGRVVLLGDTAWAPTPLTGSGTTLALCGAYILAGCLAALAPREHPEGALENYERAFRPHVVHVQAISPFWTRCHFPSSAAQRWLLHRFAACARFVMDAQQALAESALVRVLYALLWKDDKAPTKSDDADDGFKLPHYAAFDKVSAP